MFSENINRDLPFLLSEFSKSVFCQFVNFKFSQSDCVPQSQHAYNISSYDILKYVVHVYATDKVVINNDHGNTFESTAVLTQSKNTFILVRGNSLLLSERPHHINFLYVLLTTVSILCASFLTVSIIH